MTIEQPDTWYIMRDGITYTIIGETTIHEERRYIARSMYDIAEHMRQQPEPGTPFRVYLFGVHECRPFRRDYE